MNERWQSGKKRGNARAAALYSHGGVIRLSRGALEKRLRDKDAAVPWQWHRALPAPEMSAIRFHPLQPRERLLCFGDILMPLAMIPASEQSCPESRVFAANLPRLSRTVEFGDPMVIATDQILGSSKTWPGQRLPFLNNLLAPLLGINSEVVARIAPFSCSGQAADFDQLVQITRGGCARCHGRETSCRCHLHIRKQTAPRSGRRHGLRPP
ncbi:hypothetical protein [Phyllobacterium salinisoli]|uniref:hypothetical protein n=1 Tax=Phyllobacterium salinisoli TaxID=1899321 RepID=UPI00190F097F|nr:hypothetical protein [Phyllobacterium salinisoli]